MIYTAYLLAGFIYWMIAIYVCKGQRCIIRKLKAAGEEEHGEDFVIKVLFFVSLVLWPALLFINIIDLCCVPKIAWDNYQLKRKQKKQDESKS
jgi:hypothetical protein